MIIRRILLILLFILIFCCLVSSFSFLSDWMAESKTIEPLSLVDVTCLALENDIEKNQGQTPAVGHNLDNSGKGEWLQAAVLGANDGVVSAASLMMGVLAVKDGVSLRFTASLSGLVAAACSLAIKEFVSMYSNLVNAQRNRRKGATILVLEEQVPTSARALVALVLAFSVGAALQLIVAAFTVPYESKMIAVFAVASAALIMFGTIEAMLSRSPILSSCLRVLLVGLIAMAIILTLTKTISSSRMQL